MHSPSLSTKHIHDDLLKEWETDNKDPKVELRNALQRHLKRGFGPQPPAFFFVMEEHTARGNLTRPHAHGSIAVAEADLPMRGEGSRALRKVAEAEGEQVARLQAGELLIKKCLKAAAGEKPRIAVSSGLDQCRNLWRRKPYHAFFNNQWVDYAFRNAERVGATLDTQRFAMPNELRAEAEKLWGRIRA